MLRRVRFDPRVEIFFSYHTQTVNKDNKNFIIYPKKIIYHLQS